MSATLHNDYYEPLPSSPSPATFSFALGAALISTGVVMFLIMLWLIYRARKRRLQASAAHMGAFPLASPPSSAYPNFHPHMGQNVYSPYHPSYGQAHGVGHSAPYSESHPQKPPAIAVLSNAPQNLNPWTGVAPMQQPDPYSHQAPHQSGFHPPTYLLSTRLSAAGASRLNGPEGLQCPVDGVRPGAYHRLQHPAGGGGSAQSPPPETGSAEGRLGHLEKDSTGAAERERVEELAGDSKLPAYAP